MATLNIPPNLSSLTFFQCNLRTPNFSFPIKVTTTRQEKYQFLTATNHVRRTTAQGSTSEYDFVRGSHVSVLVSNTMTILGLRLIKSPTTTGVPVIYILLPMTLELVDPTTTNGMSGPRRAV
ncbi:unnamed protein product [Arabis nemorensis]|uniref:Uncharacterized protein n=1 Tax=Arabis nemorensis TaxID=586526 RepID=A0A565B618_9BRAS|nr:unnamed protein product [Arabis nemorensis]